MAWFGAAGLGVANGVARDLAYKDRVGERTAHQISTATLIAALGLYAIALERRWPLASRRDAAKTGAIWAAATVAFEFGFGHWIAHETWGDLARNYDVRKGRVWAAVPVAMAALPSLARKLAQPQPVLFPQLEQV